MSRKHARFLLNRNELIGEAAVLQAVVQMNFAGFQTRFLSCRYIQNFS